MLETSDRSMIAGQPILSVVMPAFNEEQTIEKIIGRVRRIPELLELIVVDDCSTDSTREIVERLAAEDPRIRYFRQPKNAGKTGGFFGVEPSRKRPISSPFAREMFSCA